MGNIWAKAFWTNSSFPMYKMGKERDKKKVCIKMGDHWGCFGNYIGPVLLEHEMEDGWVEPRPWLFSRQAELSWTLCTRQWAVGYLEDWGCHRQDVRLWWSGPVDVRKIAPWMIDWRGVWGGIKPRGCCRHPAWDYVIVNCNSASWIGMVG